MRLSVCPHDPPCPPADAPDRDAARILCDRPEQGWCLLCNEMILFDDDGLLLPDGRVCQPGMVSPPAGVSTSPV